VTEKARELLSILIDGEASEIEIHRLLRQMGEDDSLPEAWVSYQETRRVLRSRSNNGTESDVRLGTRQQLALYHRINELVGQDVSYSEGSGSSRPFTIFSKPAAALAMAASLTVAVFVGLQINSPGGNDIAVESGGIGTQAIGNPAISAPLRQPQSIAAQTASAGPLQVNEPIADNLELKELDDDGRRRLRAYLNQHDRMARMKPNTSLVTYPTNSP
jgi:sigma-E factor negative regulatory protein RseA